MNVAEGILFAFVAALFFRMSKHSDSKLERILWIISGICFTLSSILHFTIVVMEL